MRIKEHSGSAERRVVIGAIVDTTTLAAISANWRPDMARSGWANIVLDWCVDHYRRFGKAPKKAIEPIFRSWASDKKRNRESVALVEQFLSGLSGEYLRHKKEINSAYLIDLAGNYFNEVAVEKLSEQLSGDLGRGRVEKALDRVGQFRKVELGQGTWIDPLRDVEAMQRAFDSKSEPIIHYPGALGQFFGNCLERDGFVAFQGIPGIGKSWILQDLVHAAVAKRLNVAYVQIGDMSEADVMMRLMCRYTGKPIRAGKVRVPARLRVGKEGDASVTFRTSHKDALTLKDYQKAVDRFVRGRLKTDEPTFLLKVFPGRTVHAGSLRDMLRELTRGTWKQVDLLAVDYPDILAPMPGSSRERDDRQIDMTWGALRSIAQEFHCLVAVVTQSNTESFKAKTLRRFHFGGSRMKLAHATSFFSISVTDEEKEMGVMRLNCNKMRNQEFSEGRLVYTAQCLALADPFVLSCFRGGKARDGD